jgi:limonene-1,2-epoxide hydrolase
MSTTRASTNGTTERSAEVVVRDFLAALAAEDVDTAMELVADDIEYTNVPYPTLLGRGRLDEVFRTWLGRAGFRVHFHNVASGDGVVLTERTDALVLGPVVWQFWVYGRFEVADGRITVWRDSFDHADVLVGLVRGVLGSRWPALGRRWPAD